MADVQRKRSVRSVTLDDDLIDKLKDAGKLMVPKEENLSRLIDKAIAEFLKQNPKPASRSKK